MLVGGVVIGGVVVETGISATEPVIGHGRCSTFLQVGARRHGRLLLKAMSVHAFCLDMGCVRWWSWCSVREEVDHGMVVVRRGVEHDGVLNSRGGGRLCPELSGEEPCLGWPALLLPVAWEVDAPAMPDVGLCSAPSLCSMPP
ncbi:hypothetical protein Dimus_024158 [Dionaea muscipula]